MASMGGMYQATYKLADMMYEGLGCPKNPVSAFPMYKWVYENCIKEYNNGNAMTEFCDAAVRLGNACLDGLGTEKDVLQALGYFMEAEHAVKKRMASGGTLSDSSVLKKATQGISRAKDAIDVSTFKKHIDMPDPELLSLLLKDARLSIKTKQGARGHLQLHIKRLPLPYQEKETSILITLPTIQFCADVTKMTVHALYGKADFEDITVDHIEWDAERQECEFYYDEVLEGTLHAEGFRLMTHTASKGKTVRLVGVQFGELSAVYDYLCDDETVQEGDMVLVPTKDGDKTVRVVTVHEENERDLKLPFEKYKKVHKKM